MAIKRVAVAGIVIKNWRYLEIVVLCEIEPSPDLPRHQPGIGLRFQSSVGSAALADRILRIDIVIDKLREIGEDIDFKSPRFGCGFGNGEGFVVLRIGLLSLGHSALAKIKGKGVFPLFRRSFRVDVSIPEHQCSYKWVWHFSAGKRDIPEAFISQVSLANVDPVTVLSERTIERGGRA